MFHNPISNRQRFYEKEQLNENRFILDMPPLEDSSAEKLTDDNIRSPGSTIIT
jgi:hypothetical protein